MPARRRQYDYRERVTGSSWNTNRNPNELMQFALVGRRGVCDDVVTYSSHGKYILPNVFNSATYTYGRAMLNGKLIISGKLYKKFDSYPCDYQAEAAEPSVTFAPYSALEQSNLWWQIVTTTNPGKPDVSLPTFIGELKDVPSMLTGWGKSLSEKLISSHLNWRWGIKPFVSDVKTMLRFVELADKRFKMLQSLRNGQTIKRRCGLGSSSSTTEPRRVTLQSYLAVHAATTITSYTSKAWGTAGWRLRPRAGLTLPMTPSKLLSEAKRIVLGWKSVELLSATWELFPWSWFLDWFFKVGSIISAMNGVMSYQWSNACVMRTITARTSYSFIPPSSGDKWSVISGDHFEQLTRKLRWPVAAVGPPIDVAGPLLAGKTWSILGTLWVLQSGNGFARSLR